MQQVIEVGLRHAAAYPGKENVARAELAAVVSSLCTARAT